MNVQEINSKWGYKPIEVTGKFDFGFQFKVQTTRMALLDIIWSLHFLFVDNDTGIQNTIFVNSGFVEEDTDIFLGAHNEDLTIRGFLTIPLITKDAKENNLHNFIADHIYLNDFCKISGIETELSRNIVLHAVNFGSENELIYPLKDNLSSLNKFNVSPEVNSRISKLFSGLTFLTLFSNVYYDYAFSVITTLGLSSNFNIN